MKKIYKRLAAIAAGVAVLALALGSAVAVWVKADAFQAEIEAWVKSETGLVLSIAGGVSPAFFPALGVNIGRTTLRNPPGFGDGNLAQFERLSLRLKMTPLLTGRVVPDAVVVDGLNIHLLRSASGRRNLDVLLRSGNAVGKPLPALLAVARIKLANAALIYKDQGTGERFEISDFEFRTGPLSEHRTASFSARFRFSDPARKVAGHASLGAELSADHAQQSFGVHSSTAHLTLGGTGMPAGDVRIEASADARFHAPSLLLTLEKVQLAANGPGIGEPPVKVRIPRVAVDVNAGTTVLERFALTTAALDVEGDLAVSGLGADPALEGRVSVASSSPVELTARLGRPLPDSLRAEWLSEVRIETSLIGDLDGLTLEPFTVTLDAVRLAGRIVLGLNPTWSVAAALRSANLSDAAGDSLVLSLRGFARPLEATSTYRVDELELNLGAVAVRGTIELNASGDVPTYTADLEVPTFDPRALLHILGRPSPDTSDPKALTRAKARFVVSGSGPDLVLDPLELQLDDTEITGSLSASDTLRPSRALEFDLRADTLDTRRYLPFTVPGSGTERPAPASFAALASLNLSGRLTLDSIIVGDLVMDDLQVSARSEEGRLELKSGSRMPMPHPRGGVAASDSLAPPAP